jgi:hypothetical protein
MADAFSLGKLVTTPGALMALLRAKQSPLEFLERHMTGDWGDLCAEDAAENEYAVAHGLRILSGYTTSAGAEFGSSPRPIAPRPHSCSPMNIDFPCVAGRSVGICSE